ncbi:MAG: glycosyltransferase family 4 protein [Deltaproteobacteria bacterium]|nr:glycosyltransferase family 4 protein [Deltaproteobacteria bacterium]
MNVLVFSDEYPPAGGGAGVVASQLVSNLVAMGHKVVLLSGDEGQAPEAKAQEHVRVHRTTLIWPMAYLRALLKLRPKLSSFDAIVLNDIVAVYVAGLFFNETQLSKCVIIAHGDDAAYVFKKTSTKHHVFQIKAFCGRTLRHCMKVVAVSRYAKELYCNNIPNDPRLQNVDHHYAGLDLEGMKPLASITQTKTDIGVPEEATLLFSAGRVEEEKGFLHQFTLFKEEVDQGSNYVWLIAGDGALRDRLQAMVEANNLTERVRFLGQLPREKLATYYKLADVFWLLSHATYETMGLVYLEAAFYGTPSIGLRNFGVIEAISEGKSGYFYEGGRIGQLIDRCAENITSQDCIDHAMQFSSVSFAKYVVPASVGHRSDVVPASV